MYEGARPALESPRKGWACMVKGWFRTADESRTSVIHSPAAEPQGSRTDENDHDARHGT